MSEISYEKPLDSRFKDLSGQKFGRYLVIKWSYKKGSNHYYLCKCDCGNYRMVQAGGLRSGDRKSCGCYMRDRITTHGLTNHPLYNRCFRIIERCYDQNHVSFHNYGGREQSDPIYVQESWKNDVSLMIREMEAEIGLPPTQTHQIDRIETNDGYVSGNIQWSTPEENGRNKRDTHNHARDPITRTSTRTYNAWTQLLYNYKDEVCEEWRSDRNPDTENGFKQFLADMGEKPRYRSPIKRHDESKPFCKDNCYWG